MVTTHSAPAKDHFLRTTTDHLVDRTINGAAVVPTPPAAPEARPAQRELGISDFGVKDSPPAVIQAKRPRWVVLLVLS